MSTTPSSRAEQRTSESGDLPSAERALDAPLASIATLLVLATGAWVCGLVVVAALFVSAIL